MEETERDNEIRQIEQDLRNLQRRYGALERSARRVRILFYVLVSALAASVFVALIHGDSKALVFPGSMLIVVGAFAYALKGSRWIDQVGGPGYGLGVRYTEAQAVEDMVAERMERLRRLRGNFK